MKLLLKYDQATPYETTWDTGPQYWQGFKTFANFRRGVESFAGWWTPEFRDGLLVWRRHLHSDQGVSRTLIRVDWEGNDRQAQAELAFAMLVVMGAEWFGKDKGESILP